jgi:hypothetical protein
MTRKLKPPTNVRIVTPKVCEYCLYYKADEYGDWWCKRGLVSVPSSDVGDGYQRIVTCDLWTSAGHIRTQVSRTPES